jgi:hypothetical protein
LLEIGDEPADILGRQRSARPQANSHVQVAPRMEGGARTGSEEHCVGQARIAFEDLAKGLHAFNIARLPATRDDATLDRVATRELHWNRCGPSA